MKESYLDVTAEQGFPNPVDELLASLGLELEDRATVEAALTHPSFWGEFAIPEEKRLARSYERLEFLGDSVVALTTCRYLFQTFPEYHQGKLSKLKGHLVSKDILLRVAEKLHIGDYIRVGKGVIFGSGRKHSGFLVDCFEALVGAIFVEKGFEFAAEFTLNALRGEIDDLPSVEDLPDYKTTLQEIVQKRFKSLPVYKVVAQSGPEHKKHFTIRVFVNGAVFGEGDGSSKKEAEINAARAAIDKMSGNGFDNEES